MAAPDKLRSGCPRVKKHADGGNHQSGSGANSRANSAIHGRANRGARRSCGPDRGSVTSQLKCRRGVQSILFSPEPAGHRRCAISVSSRPEPRNTFHAAGFLRFRNHAAHHLARMRDHVSIGNHGTRESRGERISLLAMVARNRLIHAHRDPGPGRQRKLHRRVRDRRSLIASAKLPLRRRRSLIRISPVAEHLHYSQADCSDRIYAIHLKGGGARRSRILSENRQRSASEPAKIKPKSHFCCDFIIARSSTRQI